MTLRSMAAHTVASLPASLRWRTRNAIALARWLRLRASRGGADGPYADDFWALHAGGDWDGFAAAVLRHCAPRSLVDVGCGDAKLLAAIRHLAPDVPLLGIDGSREALARAAAAGVTVLHHDLASTHASDVASLRARVAGFDVAVSMETAEHLPPWAGAKFVHTLACVRLVVFSAAQPGQGGTLHMNERPGAYWRGRFAACGFRLAVADTALRTALASLDLPPWYAANIQVFERHA